MDEVGRKDMSDYFYIGKSIPRVDGMSKATGIAKYTADLFPQEKGMLFVKVVRSPYPHAKIVRIDLSKAERSNGVKFIATGKDVPEKFTWQVPPLLARRKVRWAGEGIAAVAAESVEAAEEASRLIEVHYEELPSILDAEEAMKPDCKVLVDPDWGSNPGEPRKEPELPNVTGHYKLRRGSLEEGFDQADVVLENRFSTSRIHHSQLEPISCIAQPDGLGGVTLWTNAQGVYDVRETLCDILNLPL
jgi:CO/xanthine dehydrogenase Mo-binding subunit